MSRHATLAVQPRALLLLAGCAFAIGCASGSPSALVRTEEGFRLTESGVPPIAARAPFREGQEALARGDFDAAIPAFEAAVEALPKGAAPRINLAIALRQTDRAEEAEAILKEALALHPRHVVAHNELGIVYRQLGRLDESRKSYERALDLYGDFHFAHRNLGILCDLFLRDAACALTHYRRYRELVPGDDQVAIWIADLEQRGTAGETGR